MLTLMPMMMMLAYTPMFLFDAFDVVAYAAANDANADAKIPCKLHMPFKLQLLKNIFY